MGDLVGNTFVDILDGTTDLPCTTSEAKPCAESNALVVLGKAVSEMYAVTAGEKQQLDAIMGDITSKAKYNLETGFYNFMYEYDGPCVAHGANSAFVGKDLQGIL